MTDEIGEFLAGLDGQRAPRLGKVVGRVRLELVSGDEVEAWTIAIDRGDVNVSQAHGEADCTIRADRSFFARMCRGEENAMAAVLRGAITCRGDVELLFAIQGAFPGPAGRTAEAAERGTP